MIGIGTRVKVRAVQSRIGRPKYPGRTGTVARENQFGYPDRLWYVQLDATARAGAREATFWTQDLEELPLTKNQEKQYDLNP